MSALPTTLLQLVDRAAISLAAWQVLEALTSRVGAPVDVASLVAEIGIDVDVALDAVVALEAHEVVVRDGAYVMLAPDVRGAATLLIGRVRADRTLRRDVLKLAALREMYPDRALARVARAANERPERRSLASNVPAVRDPSRSTDREAPAA